MLRMVRVLAAAVFVLSFASVGPAATAHGHSFTKAADACASSGCFAYSYCQINTLEDNQAECWATTTDMDCCCGDWAHKEPLQ